MGPDTGETVKADFDDVDDFKDWQENPISGYPAYSSTVDIYYVNSGDLDTEASIGDTEYTDFKKITVKIFREGEEKASLVTMRQGY